MAFGKKESYGKGRAAARKRRHARLRKHVSGTSERPRLSVTRSTRHVFVQVIDDTVGKTLVSASTMEADLGHSKATRPARPARWASWWPSVPRTPVSKPSSSTVEATPTTAVCRQSPKVPVKEDWPYEH